MTRTRSGVDFIRSEIRQQPPVGLFQVNPDLHRLQWNENPFDFPADLKEEVLQRLANISWARYPLGMRALELIDALAKHTGLGNNQIIVSNGSSDILRVIISAILQPGDHMLTLAPTFGSYTTLAQLAGAEVHTLDLNPAHDFALPVDQILQEAAEHTVKLIVICAPNNPTGTVYPYEQLRQIVTQSDSFVLIDEAYAEFCGQDLTPLLAEADNVILVHTLSKAFALAGVRVGYALSTPEVIRELQKVVNVFTMSAFAEVTAVVALENEARFQPLVSAPKLERLRVAVELARIPGVKVHSSGTNFLLVYIGSLGKDAHTYLRSRYQLLVTDMGMYAGYQDYLRISVGSPEENDLVIKGLTEHLTNANV